MPVQKIAQVLAKQCFLWYRGRRTDLVPSTHTLFHRSEGCPETCGGFSMSKRKLFAVCGAGRDRSPVIKLVLHRLLGDEYFSFDCAGLADGTPGIDDNETGLPASPEMVALAKERHYPSLDDHVSKPIWDIPTKDQPDIIVAASQEVADTLNRELKIEVGERR
jgi:hypothetical protein